MKKQLTSKTVWFNIVMLLLFILSILDSTVLNVLGFSSDAIAQITASIGLFTAIGNYILRAFFTSEPLNTKLVGNQPTDPRDNPPKP